MIPTLSQANDKWLHKWNHQNRLQSTVFRQQIYQLRGDRVIFFSIFFFERCFFWMTKKGWKFEIDPPKGKKVPPGRYTVALRGSFTPISIYTGYLQRCYKMICTHNLSLCSYRESKSKKNNTALTPLPFLDPPLVGVFLGIFRFNQKNP